VIAKAEILSINHGHFEQTLGEYILFLNTGLWVGIIGLIRLIGSYWWGVNFGFIVALLMLLTMLISVLYVSPIYKKRYLDILEVIQSMSDKREQGLIKKSL
jgi:hypothetical protein